MTDGTIAKLLYSMIKMKFEKDQIIFEEGKKPEAVYIVYKGEFEYVKKLE